MNVPKLLAYQNSEASTDAEAGGIPPFPKKNNIRIQKPLQEV
jgi:hypothetical protein